MKDIEGDPARWRKNGGRKRRKGERKDLTKLGID